MKADQFCAWADEVRYLNGWRSGRNNNTGNTCRDCAHFNERYTRCEIMQQRTQISAVCDHYLHTDLQTPWAGAEGEL